MQSRMDKYSVNTKSIGSRTEKNRKLYEDVKNSSMKNYEIKSNVSVIDDDADSINVNRVRRMLNEKYSEEAPKRRSIDIPDYEEKETEEVSLDTKEYDINEILAKAKKGKNVDYNKERLKKIRDAQYEILNNLDLEIKKVEKKKTKEQEDAENNLMNLINTITELEIKNKNKETETDLDLLSDLKDDDETDLTEPNKEVKPEEKEETKEETKEEVITQIIPLEDLKEKKDSKKKETQKESQNKKNDPRSVLAELKEESDRIDIASKNIKNAAVPKKDEKKEERKEVPEETLSKLDIDVTKFDDFADISKGDSGSLVLKIIIFIVVILLVLGGIYILNEILGLGLF